jgi:hypothetical protein
VCLKHLYIGVSMCVRVCICVNTYVYSCACAFVSDCVRGAIDDVLVVEHFV